MHSVEFDRECGVRGGWPVEASGEIRRPPKGADAGEGAVKRQRLPRDTRPAGRLWTPPSAPWRKPPARDGAGKAPPDKLWSYACVCGEQLEGEQKVLVHQIVCRHRRRTRSFECPGCEATFVSPGRMREHHFALHAGGRFLCDLCGVTFAQGTNLYTHFLTKHGMERQVAGSRLKALRAAVPDVEGGKHSIVRQSSFGNPRRTSPGKGEGQQPLPGREARRGHGPRGTSEEGQGRPATWPLV